MVAVSSFLQGLTATLSLVGTVYGASLQQVSSWGGSGNPSTLRMHIYVPDNRPTRSAVLVVLHPCGGSGTDTFSSITPNLRTYADRYNIILIYGSTVAGGNCWDFHSSNTKSRFQTSDSNGVVNMVNYALRTYNADPGKVFTSGFSGGCMISNVLAAVYPDVFYGVACFSGGAVGWSNTPNSRTAQQWGDQVRNCYPGYTGRRPKMQIWHGDKDTVTLPHNYNDELAQWSNVLGLSVTRTVQNSPANRFTQTIYGDGTQLMGYYSLDGQHWTGWRDEPVLSFFGLLGNSPSTTTPAATTRTTTPGSNPTTTTAATGGTAPQWAQCGGLGYTGPTACQSPFKCTYSNPYYSQCL
ncbi:hypothetical protein TWF281_003086 [Arthrobotrys megalospora]